MCRRKGGGGVWSVEDGVGGGDRLPLTDACLGVLSLRHSSVEWRITDMQSL